MSNKNTSDTFAKLEQREAELAVINNVQKALLEQKDLAQIYQLVGDHIRDLFDAQVTGIYSFDHDSGLEHFQYLFEDGEQIFPESRPLNNIRKWIIDNKSILHIKENADDAIYEITGEKHVAVPGTRLPKTLLFVPLMVGDAVMGCVSLQNLDREHAFSDSDVQLLSTLSNSMSVALENARLFNETEQRNAELAVINSVQQGLVAEMDMQGIYDLVGDKIRDLFDSQVTAIATFNHESNVEDFQYLFEEGKRMNPSPRPYDKIRQRLINTQHLINIEENAKEAYTTITGQSPKAIPGTVFPKSMVFVPLIVGETVRGYVSLQNLDREYAFSESDIRLLSTLANSMSVALENARLFNEAEQRNAELAVINSVQQGLVAEMDMQGIYNLVGERVRDLFDAQVTGIVTFNHEDKTEDFKYLFEDGQRYHPGIRPYDKVREKIIDDRSTLLFNEKAAEALSQILGKVHKPLPGTRVAKSALYVPMIVGSSVRGYVTLQNLDREFAFTESDVSLLNTLVNSMTVALENARLFNETNRLLVETEQRNAELAVINSVQEGLVREMDMNAIYKLVGNRICEVLNTQTMLIRTFNHENKMENWEYAIENGEQLHVDPRPFIWANKHLIKTKESLLINEDYVETARKYGDTEHGVSKGLPPKSAIFVPMIVGDKVIGSISLQNVEEEHAFTESDVRLLTTLTNSMSVALENARLFNETTRLLSETEQRAAELQTVNNISKAMVSQLEFDRLIEFVGEQMRETFKADIVYLAIHDQKTNMLHFPYYYGDVAESRPFGNGITEKIILSKEPLLVNHDLDETYDKIKAEKKGEMVESYLGVPIVAGNKSLGVISVQSKEQENRFAESDQRLLTTIAANVGIAMQNAEAYQKLQAALTDLRSVQEQLIQQEKLASLGQLTAGIAHEIKNPLNFVNNFSELSVELVEEVRDELRRKTQDGGPDSPLLRGVGGVSDQAEKSEKENSPLEGSAEAEHRRGVSSPFEGGKDGKAGQGDDPDSETNTDSSSSNTPHNPLSRGEAGLSPDTDLILDILDDIESNLKTIYKHGTRADSIVKSMLQHSRGGDGKMEPTPLNPIIKEYVNLAFHGMRAGKEPINVDIDLQLDESVGEVPLIAEDFSRVILNLTNNAFDAMREKMTGDGGPKTGERLNPNDQAPNSKRYSPKLTARTYKKDQSVTIEIEDNGPGIPEEMKDKILQPFFTTKKGTAGTGLGLSITNDIVKAHGGKLHIQSEEGKGTVFLITILET